jgi:hypothetical protein
VNVSQPFITFARTNGSKVDSAYLSGPCSVWIKVRNPARSPCSGSGVVHPPPRIGLAFPGPPRARSTAAAVAAAVQPDIFAYSMSGALNYRRAKDPGHLEITGGMGQSDSLASSRRPDVLAGTLRAATGVDLREIRRVSRREISQAGRDALALARLAIFKARPTQQLHPGPCNFPGSCNPSVMRSYFAPVRRASADMVRQPGAVRRTRGARAPHSGQADGSSHSAIARSCVNGPHFLHIYSYVGIDHLPPAETHFAADQSAVAIVRDYTN